MAWITPKTDWKSSDYFNITDYNRIKGNIEELKMLSDKLFKAYSIIDMGSNKTYTDLLYAKDINALEDNLQTINNNGYVQAIGEAVTWKSGKPTPKAEDYNRIEKACLTIYSRMAVDYEAIHRLSFRLGSQKGLWI